MNNPIKKYIQQTASIIVILSAAVACSVHEWPTIPENVNLHLKMNYQTEMIKWEHLYDESKIVEEKFGNTYNNSMDYGHIRYIIRAYRTLNNRRFSTVHTHEFSFTKDITQGYEHEITLPLTPGDWQILVWSDLVQNNGDMHFYNADDFAKIAIQGNHAANNDYRDAFRGIADVSVTSDIVDIVPDTVEITMQRPLAKFEFISNDLEMFIKRQTAAIAKNAQTKAIDIKDYKVKFYYIGFMPNAYSLFEDWPVTESATVPFFESSLKELNSSQATMGFDYVFVNQNTSAVSIKIGIYDNTGNELSMSNMIDIPLKRNHHTVITGKFLTLKASGGIIVDPEYNGDHNFIFL